MNNLTLFFLGLVLIYIPACLSQNNDKQCFSQALKPSYPCCKGSKVVYTDKDGKWGIEDGKWCGINSNIPSASDDSCFAVALGYKCCEKCKVVYTDKDGDWGVEKNKWCGIKDSCASPIEIDLTTTTEIEIEEATTEIEIDEPIETEIDEPVEIEIDEPIETEIDEPVEIEIDEPVSVQDESVFDLSFLKMENEKKNMLYSPLSIKYALKMLQEGADGNTYDEINNVIGNSTLTKYENIDNSLSLANGLFIRDSFYSSISTQYMNTLKEQYNAEIKKDEFKDAKNANQWIEDKTLGIIKNMLSDDVVQNPGSVMLLINALAIDMQWITQFNYNNTSGETFYMDDGQEMITTMMSKKATENDLSYYINNDITAITMDLKENNGTQLEFMAIMPNEPLSTYVENVTKTQISEIDLQLRSANFEEDGVTLRMPKFKFSYDLELKQDLIELGVKDAFDSGKADFSKMVDAKASNSKLFVSDALHKADIEFTEKGAKAAAVTVFIMRNGITASRPKEKKPVIIVFNKPFMFIIRDKNTKDIWFTGTVYEPNLWENERASYEATRGY